MNPELLEKMRIAIAEDQGWERFKSTSGKVRLAKPDGKKRAFWLGCGSIICQEPVTDPLDESCYPWLRVPNYPANLNAIAVAVATLDIDEECRWIDALEQIIREPENIAFGDKPTKKFPLNHWGRFEVANADAPKRCQAYCRVRGLLKGEV